MLNLLRIEARKILSQRWVGYLLVWMWPTGAIVAPLMIMILVLLNPPSAILNVRSNFMWTETALSAWNIPTNLFGRLLFIALASAVFSGEYQWNTWKNIVPRATRTRLILAKYIAFTALVTAGLVATSILLTIGTGLLQAARGLPYPPQIDGPTLITFLRDYVVQLLLAVVNILIGTAISGTAATLARSILGGIVAGVFFVGAELGIISAGTTLGMILQMPEIGGVVLWTSAWNILNAQSWLTEGQPTLSLLEGAPTNSLAASLFVLTVWLVVLVSLNLWLFRRQDLR